MSKRKLRALLIQANVMGLHEMDLKYSGKDWLVKVLKESGLK